MRIFEDDYYVIDTETGSLPERPNFRPVEIAIIRFKAGEVRLLEWLLNPCVDDPEFFVETGAYKVHGISTKRCREQGEDPKAVMEKVLRALNQDDNLIWAHNGLDFDHRVLSEEAIRHGLEPISKDRFRDTAAIYKGHAFGVFPDQFENFAAFSKRALGMRKKGFYFSLIHLMKTLKGLKIKIKFDKKETDKVVEVRFHRDLGINKERANRIRAYGFHRAPFDIAMTHALVQWEREHYGKFMESTE